MKKILLFLVLGSSFLLPSAFSQDHPRHGERRCEPPLKVEEMVSNLSTKQKKNLLEARERSHTRVDQLKAQLNVVRDSIRDYIHRDGDNSRTLYPLFDREADIQAQISKEMYALRVRIDAILTPEQLKEFRGVLEKQRKRKERGER